MTDPRPRFELLPDERRVLGTLIEKGLSNPQYYPMTVNALVAGCNQKNNRDPITHYSDEDVERTLETLRAIGLVSTVIGETGRVARWRQEFGSRYELRGADLGIVGELLLRGPQSEGELRTRASRMRDIPTLEDLKALLEKLRTSDPPLVVRLTPEGFTRGVRWTHALYPQAELDAIVAAEGAGGSSVTIAAAAAAAPRAEAAPRVDASSALLDRIAELEERVARIEKRLGDTFEGDPL